MARKARPPQRRELPEEQDAAAAQVTDEVLATASDAAQLPAFTSTGRVALRAVAGPAKGRVWNGESGRCSVGSHRSNDFVLEDPTVSRFHCEVSTEKRGLRVRDLDSRNGTVLDGVQVRDAFGRSGSTLRLGDSVLQLELGHERARIALSEATRFGSMLAQSTPMRAAFALLERAAASDITVLIEGETGTGKGAAATGIHDASARRAKPFVVVDCGAISPALLESELFGHEKGAFTGAVARHVGAFETAQGGTVFLDEVGELPLELQPKLLRVLEEREVRRVGSPEFFPVDVRIIAATHRDLRELVNARTFRSDLYFRLSVLRIPIPPLRARMDDLPVLTRALLAASGATPEKIDSLVTPAFIERLQTASWPGNVRELRNYLERCLVLDEPQPVVDLAAPEGLLPFATHLPFTPARTRVLREFERRYLSELLRKHRGKVLAVARAAGLDRAYVYRLIQRHGLKGDG